MNVPQEVINEFKASLDEDIAAWTEALRTDMLKEVEKFEADQPRDERGRWTDTGASPKEFSSGEEARKYATEQSKAWQKTLTAVEAKRLERYSEPEGATCAEALNQAIRKGNTASYQFAIDAIDSAIAKQTITEPIVVYRGMPDHTGNRRIQLTPGTEFIDKSFASTSLRSDVAERFTKGTPLEFGGLPGLLFKITLPKGAKAAPMGSLGHLEDEAEYVLPRNTRIRINSIEKYSDKPWVVNSEVVL